MLAILLFPVDVALRRLVLGIEDVPAWRSALKRAPAVPIAAEATVTRLKDRVKDVRDARAAKTASTPQPPPEDTIEELRSRLRR